MRLMRLPVVVSALLLLAVPCSRAQDTIETLSGSTFSGTILSNDGSFVEIETTAGMKMKVPYEQLTPESQYEMKLLITPDTAEGHLALADWCMGMKLYRSARSEFRTALRLGPLIEKEINAKFTAARTAAANELLARAKSLKAEGKIVESRDILSAIVQELPLEPASTEAAKLLADETEQRKQDALNASPAPAAKSDASSGGAGPGGTTALRPNGQPFSESTKALFQPVIDSYHKMLDDNQDGLEKSGSAGIQEFQKALKTGDQIRSKLGQMKANASGEEEVTEALQLADSKLEEAIVDVRINMSDAYMLRSSYNQASDIVSQGLAQYPKNERLRAAMNRVTSASSDNDGGWVLRGRR
jgi:tetratricopeptide (TPR) repeat protein